MKSQYRVSRPAKPLNWKEPSAVHYYYIASLRTRESCTWFPNMWKTEERETKVFTAFLSQTWRISNSPTSTELPARKQLSDRWFIPPIEFLSQSTSDLSLHPPAANWQMRFPSVPGPNFTKHYCLAKCCCGSAPSIHFMAFWPIIDICWAKIFAKRMFVLTSSMTLAPGHKFFFL